MNDKDPELEKLIKIMEQGAPMLLQLPAAPVIKSQEDLYWVKRQEVLCCICDEYKHIQKFRTIQTGYMKAFDPVCSPCLKEVANTAYLVCVGCKSVVSRMKPHVDASGFVFEKNKAYHLNQCPTCTENCNTSTLAEKMIHDRRNQK